MSQQRGDSAARAQAPHRGTPISIPWTRSLRQIGINRYYDVVIAALYDAKCYQISYFSYKEVGSRFTSLWESAHASPYILRRNKNIKIIIIVENAYFIFPV